MNLPTSVEERVKRLGCNELGVPLLLREATPNQGTGDWPHQPAQTSILQVKV